MSVSSKTLNDHLDFIEQSRAGLQDAQALERIIKSAQTRIGRYLAMQDLNVRLNKIRESIASSNDTADSDTSRPWINEGRRRCRFAPTKGSGALRSRCS